MGALDEFKKKLIDAVNDDPTISNLRSQFAGLDKTMQLYIVLGAVGFIVLIMMIILGTVMAGSISASNELNRMNQAIQYLNETDAKLAALEKKIAGQGKAPTVQVNPALPLASNLKTLASRAGIQDKSFTMNGPFTVKLDRISLRQLVQFVYYLENVNLGHTVSEVKTDARDDKLGYLWAEVRFAKAGAGASASADTGAAPAKPATSEKPTDKQ